jgi:hypothetical protein
MAIVSTLRELDVCMKQPLTIVNLRAIMLLLTRAHFSDPDNFGIFKDALGCMCYDENCKDDPAITIRLDYVPSLPDPSPRPAVWVCVDAVKFEKAAINNVAGWSEDNSRIGQVKKQATQITLTCIADSVDVTLMLAETVASFFAGIRMHLMETLNLAYFEVDSIGAPKIREKEPESYFEVDVIITMMFSFVMSANIESHRLKKFAVELLPE